MVPNQVSRLRLPEDLPPEIAKTSADRPKAHPCA